MQNYILNRIMTLIKKNSTHDEKKLQAIRYGLEAIYLNVSKLTVYFIINAFLNQFILGLLFVIFFGPIKSTSYGFHAKSSWQCWLISGIGFVGLPLISNYFYLNLTAKISIIILSLLAFALWAPADTPKRPLINTQKRQELKNHALIIVTIYSIIIIFTNTLANIASLALLYEIILINPFTYRIFNTKYNNYLYYKIN